MEKIMESEQFSHKVTTVSFIMALLVICIHANNLKYFGLTDVIGNVAYETVHLISGVLAGIAVPLFFMLSGYWFFRFNIQAESAVITVGNKLLKKVKTLLVPYLLWNTFGMVFYMTITRVPALAAQMNSGEVIVINAENVFKGIFLHKYYFTFWYLGDLIMLMILTPIFLILLRKKQAAIVACIIFAALSLFDVELYICSSNTPLFFFTGAMLANYAKEWFESKASMDKLYVGMFILLCIVRFFDIPILSRIAYIVSPFVFLKAMDIVPYKRPLWFINQSFFIYAAHVLPVTIIGQILAKVGESSIWAACSYLITSCITLIFIYVVARVLHKSIPRFYNLICGGRG